jgi:Protein of unknown function (DUF2911)
MCGRMKTNALLVSLFVLVSFSAAAQQLTLPAPSPAAMVKQTVGLTDITVEYSSPAVKKRKIWGALVPFDKAWRTGANAATKITFGKDVKIADKPVPAGSYAIVTIPTAKGWTLALNKDTTIWSAGKAYDEKQDFVRVPVTTAAIPNRERLTFLFNNTTDVDTSLELEWEKLKVIIPIKTDTEAQALASISSTLENAWRPHANAARYMAEKKDFAKAVTYIDQSLAMQSHWYNNWIKADILYKSGKVGEARTFAQTAKTLGEKDPNFFFKDDVEKALVEWKEAKK